MQTSLDLETTIDYLEQFPMFNPLGCKLGPGPPISCGLKLKVLSLRFQLLQLSINISISHSQIVTPEMVHSSSLLYYSYIP